MRPTHTAPRVDTVPTPRELSPALARKTHSAPPEAHSSGHKRWVVRSGPKEPKHRPAATSMAVPSYSHPEHVTINKGVWMSPQPGVPVLRQVVLDTTDARALAEFYRRLLDLQYRPGDRVFGRRKPGPSGPG